MHIEQKCTKCGEVFLSLGHTECGLCYQSPEQKIYKLERELHYLQREYEKAVADVVCSDRENRQLRDALKWIRVYTETSRPCYLSSVIKKVNEALGL